jgi:hypothetical protein
MRASSTIETSRTGPAGRYIPSQGNHPNAGKSGLPRMRQSIDFLAGQYFDIRLEVHSPVNGSEARVGEPDENFTTSRTGPAGRYIPSQGNHPNAGKSGLPRMRQSMPLMTISRVDFLAGQYFDIRLEVHSPVNGSEARVGEHVLVRREDTSQVRATTQTLESLGCRE